MPIACQPVSASTTALATSLFVNPIAPPRRSRSRSRVVSRRALPRWRPPALSVVLLIMVAIGVSGAAGTQLPADLTLTSILEAGDSVSVPLALRPPGDGSGRLFIAERSGAIKVWEPGSGVSAVPFLTVSGVDEFFEGGLLGLAFDPDYQSNGYFFVYYTRDRTGSNDLETVVERYQVSAGDANVADDSSGYEVFTLDQPAGNHNGGDIHFGPDGFLYIGLGDGGPDSGTAQDLNDLLGKMLRIDPCVVAAGSCAAPYTVPTGNPYVGVSGLDEIWARGLRNPYRWSFDRATGDMFIGDVGAGSREEVSMQPAGVSALNYGWDCREGSTFGPGSCSGSFTEPIFDFTHTGGDCSVLGGYRYRGCIEGLRGVYVVSDYCTGEVKFATETTPGSWTVDAPSAWNLSNFDHYGFGEDEEGEVYLLTGSDVLRFESASTCDTSDLFADGFESGDLQAWN